MTLYKSSTPRAALALAAGALTALTFGALVVLPATFDSAGVELPLSTLPETAAVGAGGIVLGSTHLEAAEEARNETRGGVSCTEGGRGETCGTGGPLTARGGRNAPTGS